MADIFPSLKQLLNEKPSTNSLFKRNKLKEYLQVIILDYIYANPVYSRLIFYGGSCLSHCYGLPRLSEDLDFVDLQGKISLSQLAEDLKTDLKKTTGLAVTITIQKFRIYVKFPLLHTLGLSAASQTNWLFVKIEVFNKFTFCSKYIIETKPLFKFNKSLLVKTFDLPTLMSTKIRAVLNRTWVKTDKKGTKLVSVKGRDYFDLMWYLEKGIKPNYNCLEMVSGKDELQKLLLKTIDNLDTRSIQLDLESFIDNPAFIKGISNKIKDILKRGLIKQGTL